MATFDSIIGKAKEMLGQSGKGNTGLMKGIMAMLTDKEHGGLGGMIQSFRERGMGDIVSSWIGTGENAKITPEQVKEGLGKERIEKVASHAGISTDEAAAQLSEELPKAIDKLTPEGKVPDEGALQRGLDFIKSKLF